MLLLLDENFPKLAVDALEQANHDVLWIRVHLPAMSDKDILKLAAREHRIVLTLDKDSVKSHFSNPFRVNRTESFYFAFTRPYKSWLPRRKEPPAGFCFRRFKKGAS